jgi:hypothetical protein
MSGLAGLLGLALLAGASFGEDQPTTKKSGKHTANKPVAPEGAKAAASAAEAKQASKTHLPAGFGKVNLTPEQHQKAMAVMETYAGQIKQLESQIHQLKAKRDSELTALLSDTQKQSLAEAKTNAQKAKEVKKEEKKAATGKTMAKVGGRFHIDPNELKALHDQAEKNIGGGGSKAEQPSKEQKIKKHESKEQPKEQPKDQPSTQEKK